MGGQQAAGGSRWLGIATSESFLEQIYYLDLTCFAGTSRRLVTSDHLPDRLGRKRSSWILRVIDNGQASTPRSNT